MNNINYVVPYDVIFSS